MSQNMLNINYIINLQKLKPSSLGEPSLMTTYRYHASLTIINLYLKEKKLSFTKYNI